MAADTFIVVYFHLNLEPVSNCRTAYTCILLFYYCQSTYLRFRTCGLSGTTIKEKKGNQLNCLWWKSLGGGFQTSRHCSAICHHPPGFPLDSTTWNIPYVPQN